MGAAIMRRRLMPTRVANLAWIGKLLGYQSVFPILWSKMRWYFLFLGLLLPTGLDIYIYGYNPL